MHPQINGIGEYITTTAAIAPTTSVSSGSPLTGLAFDRFSTRSLYQSGKLAVLFALTLASGATATVRNTFEHSDDDVSYEEFDHPYASGVATITGLDSGAAQRAVAEFNVNLAGAKRYIKPRTLITASGTLTSAAGLLILGGGEYLPAGEA